VKLNPGDWILVRDRVRRFLDIGYVWGPDSIDLSIAHRQPADTYTREDLDSEYEILGYLPTDSLVRLAKRHPLKARKRKAPTKPKRGTRARSRKRKR